MTLDLNGAAMKAQVDKIVKEQHNEVDVTATDADGGTVRAEATTAGSWWSASAWYEWAKVKGRSYGAKAGFKF